MRLLNPYYLSTHVFVPFLGLFSGVSNVFSPSWLTDITNTNVNLSTNGVSNDLGQYNFSLFTGVNNSQPIWRKTNIEKRNRKLTRSRIRREVDVNVKDNNGRISAHDIAVHGTLEELKQLLIQGADLNIKDNDGRDVLNHAAYYARWDVVEWIVKEKWAGNLSYDNKHRSWMNHAAYGASVEVFKRLLEEQKKKKNIISFQVALFESVQGENFPVIKYLVENVKDKDGTTALHFASYSGRLKVVQYLVENGADINVKNNKEQTPLLYGAGKGALEIVQYLVSRGVNLNAKDKDGNTALHFSSDKGQLKIVQYLVENGADINAKNNKEWTPLHVATARGYSDIAKWLAHSCSGLDDKNNEGYTALNIATQANNSDLAQYLEDEKNARRFAGCRV